VISDLAEDLVKLMNSDEKFDLVIGSRWIPDGKIVNWPLHRSLLSLLGNLYARKMLGMNISDATSGFRRLRLSTLSKIDIYCIASKGHGFQIEIAFAFCSNNFSIQEIPITFVEREFGKSKMNLGIAVEALRNITSLSIKNYYRKAVKKI
jgi:dolichol-phosphate mannosyltransferase